MLFAGSRSSPDEDRLLQHLFSPQNNLLTNPFRHSADYVKVELGIGLIKLITLVKLNHPFPVRIYIYLVFTLYGLASQSSVSKANP